MDKYDSILECYKACKDKDGCKYFLYATGSSKVIGSKLVVSSKLKKCYWEKTKSAECTEGWKKNNYDFYEMRGIFYIYSFDSFDI